MDQGELVRWAAARVGSGSPITPAYPPQNPPQRMRFASVLLGLFPLASATREGATPDPLVLYEFLPADCAAEIFPAAAASTLENPPQLIRRSPELSSCVAGGVGVESTDNSGSIGPRLRSDVDMSGLYGALDITEGVGAGLTLEFWIQPAVIDRGGADEPIFTLNGPEYDESTADRCGDLGGYVRSRESRK